MTNYLVQVRESGEPWKTRDRLPDAGSARAAAKILAALTTRPERMFYQGSYGSAAPKLHAFIRVTFRGRTIFDPRARAEG